MAHFVKNFDCKNEEHVMWLKQVGEVTAKTMNGDKIDITIILSKETPQWKTQWIGLIYIFNLQ
jgi:hypothetical protein